MLLALLAIWTNADYSWPKPLVLCRRQEMGCAGSPSALMVLLCVWCVVGIGARAHQEREIERYILRPPKFVRMRVRVRIRVHVTGGVLQRGLTYVGRLSEQPHWRSLAVAKTRCSGGQTKVQRWPNKVHLRAEWPVQGVPSEKVASGRCSPVSTNHVALQAGSD